MTQLQYLSTKGPDAKSFNRNQPAGLNGILNNTELYGLAARMNNGQIIEDRDGRCDKNQIASIESHVKRYLTNEGKDFIGYLKAKGKEITLDGIGSANLGSHTVAAIAKNDYLTLLLANRDFDQKVRELGKEYGLNDAESLEYVLTHEMGHAAGIEKEVDNENLLHDYFEAKASEYKSQLQSAQKAGDKEGMSAAAEPLKRYHKLANAAKSRAKLGESVLKGKEPAYTN